MIIQMMMNSFWRHTYASYVFFAPAPSCTVLIEQLTNILFVVNKFYQVFISLFILIKLLNIDMTFLMYTIEEVYGSIMFVFTCILLNYTSYITTPRTNFMNEQNGTCTQWLEIVSKNMIHYISFAVSWFKWDYIYFSRDALCPFYLLLNFCNFSNFHFNIFCLCSFQTLFVISSSSTKTTTSSSVLKMVMHNIVQFMR